MEKMILPFGYRYEVTRGSGPGGQHKNKVETCVKVINDTHGITETCQETRSKHKNFIIARDRLIKRVDAIKNDSINERNNNFRKDQINSQRRRTYNYKTGVVTDHITKKKANLDKVLDGNLDLLQ